MERRTLKRLGVLAVVVVLGGAVAANVFWRENGQAAPLPILQVRSAPERDVPRGTRIRVQVLNGTKTRGLARRATMVLRDRGYDVVETGTDTIPRDTTIIYDFTNHADIAKRAAKVLAPARVESKPDASRYLDIGIIIGSTWRAPAQPFYP